MSITRDEARAVTKTFVRQYPGALDLTYRFREDNDALYERDDLPKDLKGGYLSKDTLNPIDGRVYPGRVDVLLQNAAGADDLALTLRHEVLGHYGANTFTPGHKRDLLDGLIAAREEPSLKPLWSIIDRHYDDQPLDIRAEEVWALSCESIEPSRHQAIDDKTQRKNGQLSFRETCVDRTRLMTMADLDNVALMVAQGLRDRSRTQQTFPKVKEARAQRAPKQPSELVYLKIPFVEKEQAKDAAKAAGFWIRFDDKNTKLWYAPKGADLKKAGLDRYLPERVSAAQITPQDSFLKAIREAGLELDAPLEMDGQIHRARAEGDKGAQRSGSYAAHMDGRVPAGFIHNFKTGERVTWKYEGGDLSQRSTPENRARLDVAAVGRAAQKIAETAAKHEATAKIAQALWREAPPADASNPYCAKKGISQPDELGLKAVPAAVSDDAKALGIRVAQSPQEAAALRKAQPDAHVFLKGDLLIAARDSDSKAWTLQSVNPNFKGFMKDGRKAGLYTVAGVEPSKFAAALKDNPHTPLVVAEGYATGNAAARLLGHPVVVAFDSGNIDATIHALRVQWPERELLIAADNDHEAPSKTLPNGKPGVNVGLEKAIAAADEHKATVLFPKFAEGNKGSDWDDYARQHGDAAARKELTHQLGAYSGNGEARYELGAQIAKAARARETRTPAAAKETPEQAQKPPELSQAEQVKQTKEAPGQVRQQEPKAQAEPAPTMPQERERMAIKFAVQSIQREAAAKGQVLSAGSLEQAGKAVQERFARDPRAIEQTLHRREQYQQHAALAKVGAQQANAAIKQYAASVER